MGTLPTLDNLTKPNYPQGRRTREHLAHQGEACSPHCEIDKSSGEDKKSPHPVLPTYSWRETFLDMFLWPSTLAAV